MDFADGEDGGDFLFCLNASELENLPVTWAGDFEEEFKSLESDVDGAGSSRWVSVRKSR